jgi:predicted MFS family arabinose efflux permease
MFELFRCKYTLLSHATDKNICSATAQDVRTMIVGRLLAGIGIGISSALVPLYISEVVIS